MNNGNKLYPTPLEKVAHWVKNTPNSVFMRQPINGEYKDFTWKEVDNQARKLASALLGLGLEKGDRVAILAKNSAEWFITDYAIQLASLISVPLYPMQSPESIEYVINHSESKAIIIGKLDGAKSMESGIPAGVIRIGMPYPIDMKIDHQWNDLLAKYEPTKENPVHGMDDLMTLIYTSGTTGNPKGVMHTYGTFSFGAQNAVETLPVKPEDRFLSFLPLSHIAERFMVLGCATYSGAQVSFVESLDTFAENLQATLPTVFFAVPRLWKKFQQQITAKMPQEKLDKMLRIPLLNRIVRSKIKKALGLNKARMVVSGASPIAQSLLEWYAKIGIDINEGYGMTENLAYGPAINMPGAVKLGSVGSITALPHSEVRITEDGEIIVRSPSLMKGYYLEPEKTAETIRDGWLHTGDRGEIDSDGYLKITGRVKDVFKTSKGKFVQPNSIEGLLMRNTNIEQICVAGSGHSQPIVLIELTEDAKSRLPEDAKAIEDDIMSTVVQVNKELEHHEIIDRIFIVDDVWTPENGMLTPTMKIKRSEVERRYAPLCDKYRESKTRFVWEAQEA
ncbi:AMP-binding protein [Alkalimarinus alittae]|uniref:AMP-binding protein n=1 Tax=Alkalimarinus alittae TaxID=2961619 RepID=A0ABY6MY86_9ALTE|nr:AMP-binding protein [Alkalimarinus alittae]UZE94790.1 AMP-binding protein [Alkalimarinus alittae]